MLTEIIKNLYEDEGITKISAFYDKNGDIGIGVIKYNPYSISVKILNNDGFVTGFSNIYYHTDKRIYISEIYTYHDYRNLNIASTTSELIEFILRNFQSYLLVAIKSPYQLPIDKQITSEELNTNALFFYNKNGYEIVNYEYYKRNKEKYPLLIEEIDFIRNGRNTKEILIKKISKKEYNFIISNGIIFHKNAFINKEEIINKINLCEPRLIKKYNTKYGVI